MGCGIFRGLIHYKQDDLAYTMAKRQFNLVASKGTPDKQLERVETEYASMRERHWREHRFLRGIDRAFDEFSRQADNRVIDRALRNASGVTPSVPSWDSRRDPRDPRSPLPPFPPTDEETPYWHQQYLYAEDEPPLA